MMLNGLKVRIDRDEKVPFGTVYFIPPRRVLETEEDWIKRWAVIRNVGLLRNHPSDTMTTCRA